MSDTFTVTTDKADYAPGETAVFTASNVDTGSTVTFSVAHVNAGADGVYGTEDDQYTYDLTGTGIAWAVLDGGAGDLDGMTDGSVVTSWYVNLDAANQAFVLSGADAEGNTATAFFTDASPVDPIPTSLADGTLIEAQPTPSTGTGVIDSFLRIQASPIEQGINTDGAVQFDTKSGSHTHHIFLADIPVVTIEGTAYREIRLDINESGGDSEPLTLSRMQLWYAGTADLSNFDPSGAGDLPTGTLIWDLDSATNGGAANKIELEDWNSGSGKGDYVFYIPETFFDDIVGNPYVYLYGAFGNPNASEGGFEEFYVVTAERPDVTIEKTAAVPGDPDGIIDDVTDDITYTIKVSNTGNVELTGVTVTDKVESYAAANLGTPASPVLGVTILETGAGTHGDAVLDVGEVWTYTFVYNVVQADIDDAQAGDTDIDNTATVDTAQTAPLQDTAAVPVVEGGGGPGTFSLNVTKTPDVSTVDESGDIITYTITVQNTGTNPLTGIAVNDPLLGGPLYLAADTNDNGLNDGAENWATNGDTNDNGVLDVGETWTYTATYAVTQSDLDDRGIDASGAPDGDDDIDNTVTADSNETGADTADAFVNIIYNPDYTIEKTVTSIKNSDDSDGGAAADEASDVIHYQIVVTNTGNITLHNVVVTDPLLGALSGPTGDTNDDGIMEVGEIWTYTGTYTVQQDDIDSNGIDADGAGDDDGDIDNTATVSSDEAEDESDEAVAPIAQSPGLAIDKEFVNVTGGDGDALADAVGDVLNYTVKITNTGNVTLTGVTVVDPLTGQNISGVTLAPGASTTYNTSYTLTQDDLDKAGNAGADGDIDNTATADSNETEEVSDSEQVPLVYDPKLAIDKAFVNVTGGDGDALADAVGDVLNYTVKITNTGNVTLTGVTVVDPLTGQNISGVTLAPGASQTFNTSYTLTQNDLNKAGNAGADGDIDNTATADSNETAEANDSEQVPLVYNPKLAIEKAFVNVTGGDGDALADAVGDVLNYTVKVTNTGNVTLTGVTVVDPLTGQNISGVTLAPGANQTYNTSYVLTALDLAGAGNAGSDRDIDNTATADSNETGPVSDTETVPLVQSSFTIKKKFEVAKCDFADKVGDVIIFRIVIDNTGTTNLTNVVVKDLVEDHGQIILDSSNSTKTGDSNNDGILGVNETWTYTYKYKLTADDLFEQGDDNLLYNTATADTAQTDEQSAAVAVDLGPGVKTRSDWTTSSLKKFWDGIANNETLWQTVADGYPMSDITRPPYANADANPSNEGYVFDPVAGAYSLGLLVGDWNLNGETDAGEQTLFYTQAEAVAIMTASSTTVSADARYLLARELLASWLNYQAGNPVVDLKEGLSGDALDAQDMINWAISFLQARTLDEGGLAGGDGSLATLKILSSSPYWTVGIDGPDANGVVDGVSPVPFFDNPANDGDIPAGATLTSYLREYNNEGTILGVHIALE